MVKNYGKSIFPYQSERNVGLMSNTHLMCCKFRRQAQTRLFVKDIYSLEN